MTAYWLLFSFPAFAALLERPRYSARSTAAVAFVLMTLAIAAIIGFRNEVGADWSSYYAHFVEAGLRSFSEVFTGRGDPGYVLLNWIAARAGGGIWTVNLLCGTVFSLGLAVFVWQQPRPWLALLVAVPYLVIVVAMGYSRQGVAIGLAMLGLTALTRRGSTVWFVIWIGLAMTVHQTSILLIPIAALSAKRGRVWTTFWVGMAALCGYYVFVHDDIDRLMYIYIDREYQSEGAAIRVAMNALPAVLFLWMRSRFETMPIERRVWTNMSLISVGLVPLLFVIPSSTVVDRAALYFVPLQLFVYSRLPDTLGATPQSRSIFALLVIIYSAAVQFIWLNFSSHAQEWLPYQVVPL